jgi:glycosyltransferase involved in cell wall biosynthesis
MNVFHIIGYLSPRYGGPPKVALCLGKAVKKFGIKVSWWSTATPMELQELAYLESQAHFFEPGFPRSWYYSRKLRQDLAKKINEADLLHLHQVWDYPLYAAAQLAQKHNKPYVVSPHGIFTQRWRYASLKKRIYLNLMARPFLNKASCLCATVPAELEGFKRAGICAPYTVIPNGINPDEFASLPATREADERWPVLRDRLVVLSLGRISPEKGLDQLIPAWKQVIRQYPTAFLMIAGPDHRGYGAVIESLVDQEDLRHHVFMSGILQGRDKLLALSRADIFAQPSYSEGFSLSILEALVCGKPCVITTGCNFPEIAHVGAGEVVETNVDALSAALLKLLPLSSEERQKIGEQGKKFVLENYTWDIAARKMLTVYHCILDGRPVPLYP